MSKTLSIGIGIGTRPQPASIDANAFAVLDVRGFAYGANISCALEAPTSAM